MFKIFVATFVVTSSLFCGDARQLANKTADQMQSGHPDQLIETFEEFEESLEECEELIAEARAYLEAFIAEMNARYSVQLTLSQVIEIAKQNLDLFEIPEEFREEMLMVFDLIAGEEGNKANMAWPWQWNWVQGNGNESIFKNYDREVAFGFLEIASGTVFVVFGQLVGLIAGGGLIYDGVYRITQGGQRNFINSLRECSQ